MALSKLIQQARSRYGNSPSALLCADHPTGEKPWEMFVTDEHTEHYLALKAGGDADRGMLTGLLGGTISLGFIPFSLIFAFREDWKGVSISLSFIVIFLLIPFLWETLRPLPLPILFNRRTREVYYDHNGELYHSPWDGIQALACEFTMIGPHTGGMRNASLEILVRRLGEPDNALLVALGLPMGKTLQMQKGFWEYLRAYMNNGPWFDENGQHSESDDFVKEMLDATRMKRTGFLAYRRQEESISRWQELPRVDRCLHAALSHAVLPHALAAGVHPQHRQTPLAQPLATDRPRASASRWPNYPPD